jgi:hypothetical protein
MNELAIAPRSARVFIRVPGLSRWTLEVSNPSGVTVHDVLTRIYAFFHHQLAKEEFVLFPGPVQANSSAAFNQRTSRDPAERAQGMKRLDLVFPNIFLVGMSRATDGSDSWYIHLAPGVQG